MNPPDEISANDNRDARTGRWTALAGGRRLRAAGLIVLAAIVAIVVIAVPRHQQARTAPARTGPQRIVISIIDARAPG
jgi:hypothetical protein